LTENGKSIRPIFIQAKDEIDLEKIEVNHVLMKEDGVTRQIYELINDMISNLGISNQDEILIQDTNTEKDILILKTELENSKFISTEINSFYKNELFVDRKIKKEYKGESFKIPITIKIPFYIVQNKEKPKQALLYFIISKNLWLSLRRNIEKFFSKYLKWYFYSYKLKPKTLEKIAQKFGINKKIGGLFYGDIIEVEGESCYVVFSSDGGIYTPKDIREDQFIKFHYQMIFPEFRKEKENDEIDKSGRTFYI
jgi:hypothetical protein